jgi:hypothetical protein
MFRRSGSVPLTVGAVIVVLVVFVVVPKFAQRAVNPYQSWNDYSSNGRPANVTDKENSAPCEQAPSPVRDAENWFVMLGTGWMHLIIGLALLTILAYVAHWYVLNGRTDPNALIANDAWVQSHLRDVAETESKSAPRPTPSSNSQVAPDAVLRQVTETESQSAPRPAPSSNSQVAPDAVLRQVAETESQSAPRPAPSSNSQVAPDAVQGRAATDVPSVDLTAAPQA